MTKVGKKYRRKYKLNNIQKIIMKLDKNPVVSTHYELATPGIETVQTYTIFYKVACVNYCNWNCESGKYIGSSKAEMRICKV